MKPPRGGFRSRAAALALAASWLSVIPLFPGRALRAELLTTPPSPSSPRAPGPPKPKSPSAAAPANPSPNPNHPYAIDKGGLLPPPCPLIVPPQLPALQPVRIQPSQVAAKNRMGCLSAADAIYGPDGCPLRLCPASSGAFPSGKSR